MGMAVPRRGNHSTTPWNSQSHAVELAVPKAGPGMQCRCFHVSGFPGCDRADEDFKQTLQRIPNHRKGDGQEDATKRKDKKIRCPVGKSNGLI